MSFRVRTSKYRHVYGSAYKKEHCYEGIKITKNAHEGHFCAVNPKHLAIVTEVAGGGSFIIVPIEKTGRLDVNTPKVCGHKGPVLDIKWNPFHDNVIASASDDSTVKLWQIPQEGLEGNLTDWLVDLHGHTRRVGQLEWHPTAENILLSSGYDHSCMLWNVETAEPVNVMAGRHPDNIFSLAWNRDGSVFGTTCKDKKLRVIDPRLSKVVLETPCHQGTKAAKAVFLNNNRLLTTGFSKSCERQYSVWDLKNMSQALKTDSIDSSSGVMFPFFDYDTNVLFLAGKGDGNIRYYEIVNDDPYIHYLNQYHSGFPQRGLGFMPKRGLDTSRCEIFRFYKLHTTKQLCEPISMIVPRKSEMFQEDIFPPSASAIPSLSADEWIAGNNRDPILMSLKDGQILAAPKTTVANALQRQLAISEDDISEEPFNLDKTPDEYPRPLKIVSRLASGYSECAHPGPVSDMSDNLATCSSQTSRPVCKSEARINLRRDVTESNNGKVICARVKTSLSLQNSKQNVTTITRSASCRFSQNVYSEHASDNKRRQVNRRHSVQMTQTRVTNSTSAKITPKKEKTSTNDPVKPNCSRSSKKLELTFVCSPNKLASKPVSSPSKNFQNKNDPVKTPASKVKDKSRLLMEQKKMNRCKSPRPEKGTVLRLRRHFSDSKLLKDGSPVTNTPTITTYKAVKRAGGKTAQEAPPGGGGSGKRTAPTKTVSLDTGRAEKKQPASVQNIAKLSGSELADVNDNSKHSESVDVSGRIGMFENKHQNTDKRWKSSYNSPVKTEVAQLSPSSPTAKPNLNARKDEPPRSATHQMAPVSTSTDGSLSRASTVTVVTRGMAQPLTKRNKSSVITAHSVNDATESRPGQKTVPLHFASEKTEKAPAQSKAPAVTVNSNMANGGTVYKSPASSSSDVDLSASDDDLTPTPSPVKRPQTHKKKGGANLAVRKRREKKILNESSDVSDVFTTPPMSPTGTIGAMRSKPSSWSENPLYSQDSAQGRSKKSRGHAAPLQPVDISALDDALQDFEEISSKMSEESSRQSSVGSPSYTGGVSELRKKLDAHRNKTVVLYPISTSLTNIGGDTLSVANDQGSTVSQRTASAKDVRKTEFSNAGLSVKKDHSPTEKLFQPYSPTSFSSVAPRLTNKTSSKSVENVLKDSKITIPDNKLSQQYGYDQSDKESSLDGLINSLREGRFASSPERVGSPGSARSGSSISEQSTEMIDYISTDAPDDTLIKPSKMRASLRSKRRHTTEINFKPSSIVSVPAQNAPPQKCPPSPIDIGASAPDLQSSNFKRSWQTSSYREKVSSQTVPEFHESPFQRSSSVRDYKRRGFELSTSNKPAASSEMNSQYSAQNLSAKPSNLDTVKSEKKFELNNNVYAESSTVKPQQSRPLCLKIETTRASSFDATRTTPTENARSTPIDTVARHSPATRSPQMRSPAAGFRSPASATAPLLSPGRGAPLMFTPSSAEDMSPDKVIMPLSEITQPVSNGVVSLASKEAPSIPADNKIHVKKVWSPRLTQNDPAFSYQNGETHTNAPNTDAELRKAYFRQLEEIHSLKEQINYKDKRIRQLEEELKMLRCGPANVDESIC